MKNKKTITILSIFTIIFTVLGGTLAYFNWQTSELQRTNVVFTVKSDFSCAADGGGNITNNDAIIAPASCLNETYAIQREVTVTPSISRDGLSIYMDLWLNVVDIDDGLSNSDYFNYALTTSNNDCLTEPIASGTFKGLKDGDKIPLLNQQVYSNSTPQKYYLYIWLDALETSSDTMNQKFNLSLGGTCSDTKQSYKETILNGADPELETGMIPVTISDTGVVTTADTSTEWYSYEDKQWANAVLVKKDADTSVTGSKSREYYMSNPGETIIESDILAYYVWIPRYKYTFPKADGNPELISIVFENKDTDKSVPVSGKASGTEYYTHPAFTFGTSELNGIWVGKFETTGSGDIPTVLPNASSLRSQNISTEFVTSLKFAGGTLTDGVVTFSNNNVYGLTTDTDSHMMKNSEWGAVAYLSHSLYGINDEIRINNFYNESDGYYKTGCGAASGLTATSTTCSIAYGIPSGETNTYPQSTTGNISGIFDISGGAWERMMGVLADSEGNPRSGDSDIYNSGFYGELYNDGNGGINETGIAFPDEKYYDLYKTTTSTTACNGGVCYGHALSETAGWYDDYAYFVSSGFPWFDRGGNAVDDVSAGAFNSDWSNGSANIGTSWRSVIIAS